MVSRIFTLKQIEALIWVADLGSFRKAAHHLNTTQPNISARIAALESTLGVILMQRDAGSVRLTERGDEILTVARGILRQSQDLIDVARRPDLVQDRLRLGVTELVAGTWLHTYLRRLKDTYPAISVELTVDLSRNLDQALGRNELDLTLQNTPYVNAASGVIELGRYPYIWVADPETAIQFAGRVSVRDVSQHAILTHARYTQSYIELADHAESLGCSRTRFVPSSSLASSCQMALDGMGIALVPRALVAKDISAGRLVTIDVDWLPSPLQFAARFHAEKAARFIGHAAELAEEVAKVHKTRIDDQFS